MDATQIRTAIEDIAGEQDPTVKNLKLASLCIGLWAERGVQLVVVGGSAIEILTDGAYVSGDLDLCHVTAANLPLRQRQEVMGLLGTKGGPRSWQVAGMFVDLLGQVETFSRTPFRHVQAPYGEVLLMKPEDLFVERVLVSVYPQEYLPARDCARKLASLALGGALDLDWSEVVRLANLPEYRNLPECKALIREIADELKLKNPLDSD